MITVEIPIDDIGIRATKNLKQWCRDNFGPDSFNDVTGLWTWGLMEDDVLKIVFDFHNEEDAVLFKLRWV